MPPPRLSWDPRPAVPLVDRLRAWRRAASQFLYGMTGFEFAQHANHMRHEQNVLLLVLTFGDMVGVPVMPPYYALRLLPYVVPEVETWKRQVLRERYALDNEEFDLIEI
jgi:hypothetical protein